MLISKSFCPEKWEKTKQKRGDIQWNLKNAKIARFFRSGAAKIGTLDFIFTEGEDKIIIHQILLRDINVNVFTCHIWTIQISSLIFLGDLSQFDG
jgi:hypothetical protein